MSDDNEEIELLDFDDEENTIKTTDKPIVVKPEKNKEHLKENKVIIEETIINEFLDGKNTTTNKQQKISTENIEKNKRSKIIVAKQRTNTTLNQSNKQNNKTKSNSGYIIIIGVIIIVLLIMVKMILNIEEKHNKNYQENNKEINTKQKEEKNNSELTTTCKLIDNQTNQNIKTEKEISFVSVDQKIKKIIKSEKEIYLTQDATYISKISTCSTNVSEHNSYVGYNISCNIDDHNNTITTITNYDLSKIDSNNIQVLKPPVLLDSNIQDVITNYSNMNYICK